jgi:hypothetical protein
LTFLFEQVASAMPKHTKKNRAPSGSGNMRVAVAVLQLQLQVAQVASASAMPTHTKKNGALRALRPLKRASISAVLPA